MVGVRLLRYSTGAVEVTDSPTDSLTLHECRNCGVVSTSPSIGGCPSCEFNETTEYEVNRIDGEGTETREKPWYRSYEVDLR